MGIKDLARRLRASVDDLDDERLQRRFAEHDLLPLAELTPRVHARVGGEVIRSRVTPRSGVPAYEVTVSDGTGTAVAVFTGRRHVGGLDHQRGVALEGVARLERGRLVLLNPAYTLLS